MIWTWTSLDLFLWSVACVSGIFILSRCDPDGESPLNNSFCSFVLALAIPPLAILFWRFLPYVFVAMFSTLVVTISIGMPCAFLLFLWQRLTR